MSLVLVASLAIRLLALFYSVALWRRLRDWRMSFLTLMLLFMFIRQFWTLRLTAQPGASLVLSHLEELPGFLVSILALLAVHFLAKLLYQESQLTSRLQEQRQQMLDLLNNLTSVVWMSTPDGSKILHINPVVREIYGQPPEAFYENPRLWLEVVHPEDRCRVEQISNQLIEKGVLELEYRIVRPDGTVRWILDRKSAVRNAAGEVQFLSGTATDITEMVRTRERLRIGQRLLEEAEQALHMGIFEWEIAPDRFEWSSGLSRILGSRPEPFRGSFQDFLNFTLPEEREKTRQQLQSALAKQDRVTFRLRIRRREGEERVLQTVLYALRNGSGKVDRVIGVCRDVTEEEEMRERVQEQEYRLTRLLQTTLDGFILADDRGQIIEVNPAYCKITGFSREELLQKNIVELEALLTPEQVAEKIQNMVTAGSAQFETQHWRKDGSKVDLAVSITVFAEEARHLVAAFVRDISEQKRWQKQLLEQKQKLDLALNAARMGIWEWNLESNQVYWSEQVEELFDLKPATFRGTYQAFLEKLLPEHRETVQQTLKHSLARGKSFQVSYAIRTEKGQIRWHEARGMVIHNEQGQPIQMLGTVMDITEQKMAELKLRRSEEQLRALASHLQTVREEERAMIARELHDELGQILTALKMDLSLLQRELQQNPLPTQLAHVSQELRGMIQLVDRTIQRTRKLITELRPEILDLLSLPEACQWQVNEFTSRTGIPCELVIEGDFGQLGREEKIALFRILQEGLTNIARHAKARTAQVALRRKDGYLHLEIRDDGQGIPPEKLEAQTSYGLLGIRERAILLKGSMKIHSRPGKGTHLMVSIPLPSSS